MVEPKMLLRPTIADVAGRAGVSIATVSRVINQTGPVAEETAAQVRAAIAELKYVPHAAARGLASRRTQTLGLLLPGISDQFSAAMLRGIEMGAREGGYDLLIHSTHSEGGSGPSSRRRLGEHNTDGLLVFIDSLDEAELTRLYHLGFPMVLLHRSSPASLHIPCVTFENKSGSRKLIDHLIEAHGRQRIAFLRGPEGNEDSYWREMGYREALAAHNLPFDSALIALGGFDQEQARSSVETWLGQGVEIDAIFSGDDEAGIGALVALQRAGKRVPEDIALVGFDDVDVSRYLTPPLTTVRAPIEQAGREAARKLVQLIKSGQTAPLVLLPTELVIRRSCGCG
ncbi:MAG: LacI family DNA-binding transcriptional regulator [Anaerolineales bacterium]|nr:LacI family DNA-binding transcriptional regulator [Anaerolineales bacterium]